MYAAETICRPLAPTAKGKSVDSAAGSVKARINQKEQFSANKEQFSFSCTGKSPAVVDGDDWAIAAIANNNSEPRWPCDLIRTVVQCVG